MSTIPSSPHGPQIPCKWLCYILESTDGRRTYVGATDNLLRRLGDHNGLHGASRGAKATKGRQWVPFVYVDGFPSKIACLSFESGVRRIARRRANLRYPITSTALRRLRPRARRIHCLYNLLYAGSNLKKWKKEGLCVNWLEGDARPHHYIVPMGVAERLEFSEMSVAEKNETTCDPPPPFINTAITSNALHRKSPHSNDSSSTDGITPTCPTI